MLAVLSVAVLTVACGSDSTGPDGGNNANGDFTVSVGNGTRPNYSWTVGGAFSLSVVRTAAPTTIVWGIADPQARNIASPVTHGTIPNGKLPSATTEQSLTAGVQYRVSVTLADGRTGWKDFTP